MTINIIIIITICTFCKTHCITILVRTYYMILRSTYIDIGYPKTQNIDRHTKIVQYVDENIQCISSWSGI